MREFIRHPVEVPVRIREAPQHTTRTHFLRNLSQGGLCFRSETSRNTGELIQLDLMLSTDEFSLTGLVIWCRAVDGGFDIGIRFENEKAEFVARLVEQIAHIEAYRARVLQSGRNITTDQAAHEWIAQYGARFPR